MYNASLLSLLRAGTQHNHQQLETHPMLRPLIRGELSHHHYTRVLEAFQTLYQSLEPWLLDTVTAEAIPSYYYVPRLPLLKEDLAALDVPADTSPATLPLPPSALPLRAAVLPGCLYVLEGATQGGRLIGPRLCQTLSLEPGRGASYFHLFQQGQWASIESHLRSLPADGHNASENVAAAQALFGFVATCLDHHPPPSVRH